MCYVNDTIVLKTGVDICFRVFLSRRNYVEKLGHMPTET